MSGSWVEVREATRLQCDGLIVNAPYYETLTAYEYAPAGRQDAPQWPYAFILPMGRTVRHEPGMQRYTVTDLTVRVFVAPRGQFDMEAIQGRYDAWCDALSDAFDDALAMDYTVDQWLVQQFGPLILFNDLDDGWGFDMTFGQIELSETKEPGG